MKIPKISGKQVSLLIARFIQKDIRSYKAQLEFIEFECDIEVSKLEDINVGQLDYILSKISTHDS